jgi:hypothetical protein
MSKILDSNSANKTIQSMSSRQQILYLMNKTQSQEGWEVDLKENNPEDLPDYHEYYLQQKQKLRNSMPKHLQDERNKLLKLSMKEFTHIKKNVYIDRKKYPFLEEHAMMCSCDRPKPKGASEDDMFGCGKACLNKMVSTECVETICPAGKACRNRRFQLHEYAEVYPVKTKDRVIYIFTNRDGVYVLGNYYQKALL